MTAPAQVQGPLMPGLQSRPPWQIRGLLSNRPDGPTACLRLPAGLAESPEQALSVARKKFPDTMRLLAASKWRAFPVTDVEAEVL